MTEPIFDISIEKQSEIPLYQQIADGIATLIVAGILLADEKLPPIRKMANHFTVNTVTIVNAYKYLEQKKMVYSRVGSGTYVSPLPIEKLSSPITRKNMEYMQYLPVWNNVINFTDTSLPDDLFPVDEFKYAFDCVLEREKGGAFRYTDSMGYLPLRETLCQYLASFGIQTTADYVQIVAGAQQGMDIIAKALLQYGDTVFVETPTFYGAAGAFLSKGAKLVEIPMQSDGMDMIALENYLKLYHPKFLYMMAYFQTPTGISYSLEKKRRLLELAEKYDIDIIEEDDFYDFHYTKEKPLPLKALDYKNRVIYIKSFSKILMPGLRMGLMVLPKKIKTAVLEAKYMTDISTSGFMQKAMQEYLEVNGWELRGKQVRKYGGEKYRKAVSMAKKYLLPMVTYQVPYGGVSLWIELPKHIDAEVFCNRALEKNVLVSPGTQFLVGSTKSNHIRLSFASLSDDKIEVGMKRLGEVLQGML